MTENGEGTQTSAEEQVPAKSGLSGGEEGKQLSQHGYVSKKDFDDLKSSLVDISHQLKGLQGKQDKFEHSMVKKLESYGVELTPEILDKIERDDLKDALREVQSQLDVMGKASPARQNTPNYAEIIENAGLDPNDEELVQLAAQHRDNLPQFYIELGKRAANTTPAAGGTTISQGGGSPQKSDLKTLQEDMKTYEKALNDNDAFLANKLRTEFERKHGNAWANIIWTRD